MQVAAFPSTLGGMLCWTNRTVHLDSSNIGVDAGAKVMADAVTQQELYLGKNKIGDALLKEIKTILRNKESSARKGGRS